MTQRIDIFGVENLKLNFGRAIAMNCKIELRDGEPNYLFQDTSGIKIFAYESSLTELSERLSGLTFSAAPVSTNALPRLMLETAIVASCMELVVSKPSIDSKIISVLNHRISIDFALICSLALARAYGHAFLREQLQWDVMRSVLMVKDDDSLCLLFENLLSPQLPVMQDQRSNVLTRSVEYRVLSSESYWNLVSMAYAENWSDSVIVRLIEEYLSVTSQPDLVHYTGGATSGDEWRRIYGRVYG